MPAQFATVADFNAVTGTNYAEDDVRLLRLIEMASAAIQMETKQVIALVEGDEVTLPTWDDILLPQRPVLAVDEVTLNEINLLPSVQPATSYHWDRWGTLDPVFINGTLSVWPRGSTVTVTYDHGYAVIPDDIVLVTCKIAEGIRGFNTEHADASVAFTAEDRKAMRLKYGFVRMSVPIRSR